MSFFGKVFRKVGKIALSPFLAPLWQSLFKKLQREIQKMPEDPVSDEHRLVMASGVLSVGQAAAMTLISEVHQGFQGVGSIQFRSASEGSFVDIQTGSTFSGTSPFEYSSQQHEQFLSITPNSPGTYFLRVKIVAQGGAIYYTNEIRRKVLGMSGGVID